MFLNKVRSLSIIVRRASTSVHVQNSPPSTVCPKEQEFFRELSHSWWDDNGMVKLLQNMTPVRVELLQKNLIKAGLIDTASCEPSTPLENLNILDIGCGGGFLSEMMAKRGANVTGIDASPDLIRVANSHMKLTPLLKDRLTYVNGTIEAFAMENAEKFDVIVSSEVIEHVLDKEIFARHALQCLRPGGSAFFTTMNRTLISGFYYIFLCENVFKFIPKGAHEYSKFMRPTEMANLFRRYNCITTNVDGFTLNPITRKWNAISSTKLNFALHATKLRSYH